MVGHYEAVVVHADHGAVNFFAKFGFTDDILLNSKWRSVTVLNAEKKKKKS